jgi:hypothetical protein
MRRRRAFSLVEAIVSSAILGLIAMGMAGALVVVAKAAPTNDTAGVATSRLHAAMSEMSADLRYMTSVSARGATFIEFTVADRDNNGSEETIRYDWAGAGSPIRKTYNAGTPVDIVPAASTFALTTSTTKTTVTSTQSVTGSSGDVLLSQWSGWPLIPPTLTQTALNSASWATSYFKIDQVTLPANMSKLEITRLRVRLRKSSTPTGTTVTAGIYATNTSSRPEPSTTQQGSTDSVLVANLPSSFSGLIDIPLTGVVFTTPPVELNWVVKGTGTFSGILQYCNSTLGITDTPVYLFCSDSGGTWLPSRNTNQNDCPFEVWGYYEWPATATVTTDYYNLRSVSVSIATSATATPTTTSIRTLNQPSVTGP